MVRAAPDNSGSSSRRRGFSLIELLMAIFILGIGVVSIAALFPAGISQQRRSVDEVMGPIVAGNAISILRTKMRHGYFGTFEQFTVEPYLPLFPIVTAPEPSQVPGDWRWLRPGFIFEDDPATAEIDERGAIDIFSHEYWSGSALESATEFGPSGYVDGGEIDGVNSTATLPGTGPLYGIPFDPNRFPGGPPRILVAQGERAFPMYSHDTLEGEQARPEYYWECMFRRYQGRVQVAIFVFRVTYPPGVSAPYTVTKNPSNPEVPPVPIEIDLTDGAQASTGAWDSFGPDGARGGGDDAVIPFTAPDTVFDPTDHAQQWQLPRQWIIDQNNNVHRVLAGRLSQDDGPVEMVRPVQEMPDVPLYRYPWLYDGSSFFTDYDTDGNGLADLDVVERIWFMPVENELDLDDDGTPETPVTLSPVFLMMEEL